MIHILRSEDKQFYRVTTGHNKEPLVNMELVKTKKSVIKNILADWKENFNGGVHESESIMFQDDTLPVPAVFSLFADGSIFPAFEIKTIAIKTKK